jgi:hypothetical protein
MLSARLNSWGMRCRSQCRERFPHFSFSSSRIDHRGDVTHPERSMLLCILKMLPIVAIAFSPSLAMAECGPPVTESSHIRISDQTPEETQVYEPSTAKRLGTHCEALRARMNLLEY